MLVLGGLPGLGAACGGSATMSTTAPTTATNPVNTTTTSATPATYPVVSMPLGQYGMAVTAQGGEFGNWPISTTPVQPLAAGTITVRGVSVTGGDIDVYLLPKDASEQARVRCLKLPFDCSLIVGAQGPVRLQNDVDKIAGTVAGIDKAAVDLWYIARGTVGAVVSGGMNISITGTR